MTDNAPQTNIPTALRAKREALIQAAAPAAPAQPAPNVVQLQQTPQNVQIEGQPAPAPAPTPTPTPAPVPNATPVAEFDMSAFIVEEQAPAPAAPSAPSAPAAGANPFAAPAPVADPNDTYRADMLKLQGQVDAMQRMQGQAQAAAPVTQQQADAVKAAKRMLSIDASALTPEEAEKYAGSIPIINKLINNALMTHVDPALAQINGRTVDPEVMKQLTTTVQTTANTGYTSTLYTAIPDLDTLAATPEFQTYMDRPIPHTGGALTVRSMLTRAHANKDVATLRSIMGEFRGTLQGGGAVPPAAAMHAPAAAPAAVTAAPNGGSKPTLKYSARVKAGKDFQMGRITKAQLDKVAAFYDEAFKENRVDMNK